MKAKIRCFRAVVLFAGPDGAGTTTREYFVYAGRKSTATRTLREGLMRDPFNPLAPPARVAALNGQLVELVPAGNIPPARLVADHAPSRETRG